MPFNRIREHFAGPKEVPDEDPGFSVETSDKYFDVLYICMSGRIDMKNASAVRRAVVKLIESHPLKNIVLDLSEVTYFDSAGTAFLIDVRNVCKRLDNTVKLEHVPEKIRNFIEFVDIEAVEAKGILNPRPLPNLFVEAGAGLQKFSHDFREVVTFIGGVILSAFKNVAHPARVKWDGTAQLIERGGSDAVPIVSILSFLMGAVLAFQAAIQLRKFGANIFVADLVSVSICLEMGPLMTALIVAGRSGAAFAAHIGTMQVNEEIDALRIMGIDPVKYLVVPRVIAIAIALPCLTLFADVIGIMGGSAVAAISLDITPQGFFNQVNKVLEISDVLKGLLKSFIFGIEIALIGCLRGFQVRGGAENVGVSTTSAVVTCIFALSITDAIFAVLFYYGPTIVL